MFESILVGTDGSDGAAIAVAHAAELARLGGGTLHLVSVGKPVTAAMLAGDPLAGSVALQVPPEELKAELDSVLERAAAPARAAGIKVELHSVIGSPAEMLVELAEHINADVIVVGNRGMLGARRFLGSVPNTVAHHAHCSVLIVETQERDAK